MSEQIKSDRIWSGALVDPADPERHLRRADGVDSPLSFMEIQTLIAEIVATQRGALAANEGVARLAAQLKEVAAQGAAQGDRTEHQGVILLQAVAILETLTANVTAAGKAVGALLTRLTDQPDWTALANGLTANGDKTATAVKELCDRLAVRDRERDELLAEFGDVERLRYWIAFAARCRRMFARVLKTDEEKLQL